MASTAASSALRSSSMKWAAGGWTFFIAENLILSENRTYLIEQLGDGAYHAVYGTLSTIATASIGYAYLYKIPKNVPPLLWSVSSAAPMPSRVAAWFLLSLGASMASQVLPKLQIPVAYVSSGGTPEESTKVPTAVQPETTGQWKVQCPFDFTDSKAGSSEDEPHGLDRISRHPGLWSMGFMCLGQKHVYFHLFLRKCGGASQPLWPWLVARIRIVVFVVALVAVYHQSMTQRQAMFPL